MLKTPSLLLMMSLLLQLLSIATFFGAIFCFVAFCFKSLYVYIALFAIGELLVFAVQVIFYFFWGQNYWYYTIICCFAVAASSIIVLYVLSLDFGPSYALYVKRFSPEYASGMT